MKLDITTKLDTMSSLEIAELTGKLHFNVLRDIKAIVNELNGLEMPSDLIASNSDSDIALIECKEHGFVVSEYKDKAKRKKPCYRLTKKACLLLVSGYSVKLRLAIIERWEYLEQQLDELKVRGISTEHQKKLHAELQAYLPDGEKSNSEHYRRMNAAVNVITSRYFGFHYLKKDDMNAEMLKVRDEVNQQYVLILNRTDDVDKTESILEELYRKG